MRQGTEAEMKREKSKILVASRCFGSTATEGCDWTG